MNEIKIVNQREDNDCAIACVAMVTGLPYERVIGNVKAVDRGLSDRQTTLLLMKLGFYVEDYGFRSSSLAHGGLYIAAVPSLNIPGHMHYVVVDVRTPGDADGIVYDPNYERKGKKWYGQPETRIVYSWGKLLQIKQIPQDPI